jgi:hypothetical protein
VKIGRDGTFALARRDHGYIGAIARAIEGALGLPRVQVDDSERVKLALAAVADRIDIADTLHVASMPGDARAFATFDRDRATRQRATESDRGPLVNSPTKVDRRSAVDRAYPPHPAGIAHRLQPVGHFVDLSFRIQRIRSSTGFGFG